MNSKLYNVRMFADAAGISHQYIYKALKEKTSAFPSPYMYVGNSPAWSEAQVKKYIEEKGRKNEH